MVSWLLTHSLTLIEMLLHLKMVKKVFKQDTYFLHIWLKSKFSWQLLLLAHSRVKFVNLSIPFKSRQPLMYLTLSELCNIHKTKKHKTNAETWATTVVCCSFKTIYNSSNKHLDKITSSIGFIHKVAFKYGYCIEGWTEEKYGHMLK